MMAPALSVVVHDVGASNWRACRELLQCVQAVAPLNATLLVVPHYHHHESNRPFEEWLQQAQAAGHELALHGWSHLDERPITGPLDRLRRRWYTASEGEFAALPGSEAARRLHAGRRWFAERALALHGFIAPAWLMSAGTWQALQDQPFQYTCTLTRLIALPRGSGSLYSQSLVYSTRAAWRRALSTTWVAAVAAAHAQRPLVRFELHPADAQWPAIRRSWGTLLQRALLRQQRLPLTLAAAARAMVRPPAASDHRQRGAGGERTDAGTDDDVARIVQPENDARTRHP
jgi:uncharacterized protein